MSYIEKHFWFALGPLHVGSRVTMTSCFVGTNSACSQSSRRYIANVNRPLSERERGKKVLNNRKLLEKTQNLKPGGYYSKQHISIKLRATILSTHLFSENMQLFHLRPRIFFRKMHNLKLEWNNSVSLEDLEGDLKVLCFVHGGEKKRKHDSD